MKVNQFNVGQHCLSEEECIRQGINFAGYERGVKHAEHVAQRAAEKQAKEASDLIGQPVPAEEDHRMTLINSLVASKGWNRGYAAAFVDDWFHARCQKVTPRT